MDKQYEIVVPVVRENVNFFIAFVLPALRKYFHSFRIVVLASRSLQEKVEMAGCDFVDEDDVVPSMTIDRIKFLFQQKKIRVERAGWYFQQFLKMGWSRYTHSLYYLVWDSDTVPLSEIIFFDSDGHILYNEKNEHHEPYFQTMQNLFGGKVWKKISGSFIAEHMMIDQKLMREMLDEIELNPILSGECFFEKILNAVPEGSLSHSGFSEFETFGNWIITYHPEKYRKRKLTSLRQGSVFLGESPAPEKLLWASRYYNIASFEKKAAPKITVSCFMPFLVSGLRFLGVPLPVSVHCYDRVRSLFYRFILRKNILIIE